MAKLVRNEKTKQVKWVEEPLFAVVWIGSSLLLFFECVCGGGMSELKHGIYLNKLRDLEYFMEVSALTPFFY